MSGAVLARKLQSGAGTWRVDSHDQANWWLETVETAEYLSIGFPRNNDTEATNDRDEAVLKLGYGSNKAIARSTVVDENTAPSSHGIVFAWAVITLSVGVVLILVALLSGVAVVGSIGFVVTGGALLVAALSVMRDDPEAE